jgi:hypothetical protein
MRNRIEPEILEIDQYEQVQFVIHVLSRRGNAFFMPEKVSRYFVLRDTKRNEINIFSGKSPKQAALKAANRGVKDIRNALACMPEKISKPNVKKIGIEKPKNI